LLLAGRKLGAADAGKNNIASRANGGLQGRHEAALRERDHQQRRRKPGGRHHAEDGRGARPKVSQRVGNRQRSDTSSLNRKHDAGSYAAAWPWPARRWRRRPDRAARAQRLEIPRSNLEMGRIIEPTAYGMPSKFEAQVSRRRTDVSVNKQNWSDWSMTPLTPARHHHPQRLVLRASSRRRPDIDPDKHNLVIHGMVKQPLKFSMSDLMRYPSVSKFYFLECSGNGLTDWTKAASTSVQQSHGLLSCAQWTGIPVATLLDEAGMDPAAKWVLFEGADGSAHARSIPIQKVMADTLLVYGQNGERLRPEQGYPARVHPGLGRQFRSNGSGASRCRTSPGTCAVRPRATRTRCPRANGVSSAS
jgi:hypothetical protein